MLWLLLTIGLPPRATAQEFLSDDGTLGPVDLASPALSDPDLPLTHAVGWWWVSTGPRAIPDLTDVAIHPTSDEIWVVAAADGGVWVTYDGGQVWVDVLQPYEVALSGDEDILREVEARVEEMTDGAGIGDPDDEFLDEDEIADIEDQIAAATDEAQEAIDQVQSELEGDQWFLDESELALGSRPRVWFTISGLLVAARGDGLRISEDLGASWVPVLDRAVTSFAEVPGRGWVAGTPGGLYTSRNLLDWEPERTLTGRDVRDTVADGGLYVVTSDGIWFSEDLERFRQLSAWFDEAWTVRPVTEPDPPSWLGGPRALVLGAPDTLWYAPDPARAAASPAQGGPVRAAREVVRRDVAMLMAASASGPFESTDGGITWVRIARGLEATDCRALEVRGEIVLLASGAGLHRLRPLPRDREAPELEPWVPLPVLVDASLGRRELNQRIGSRWVAAMMPRVALTYQRRDTERDSWDAATWTTIDLDTYWTTTVQLTWTPNRQRSGTAFDVDDLAVFTVGDEIAIDQGTSPLLLYSQVSRGVTGYRDDLAGTISGLYLSRQRLVLERALVAGESLVQQVDRELRIAEVEARLDALTNGAVSAWSLNPSGDEP